MILLTIATAVQFVILLILAVFVLSLARQVGILHERLSPAGVERTRSGIGVGERLPMEKLDALSGAPVEIGPASEPQALLFVAADCPICRSVLPGFERGLAESGMAGYWISDGLPATGEEFPDYAAYASEHHIDPDRFLISQELGLALGVRQLPALVLLDDNSRLQSLDVLSGPRQLRRIFEAQRASPAEEKST